MALSPSPAMSRVHSATDLPFSRPGTPVLHPANLVQAFVGLGSMGYFMARNIARQSEKSLLVWNRTRTKSEKLQRELGPDKIKIVDSIADVAGLADVIFTNLANDQVVNAVYDEIVSFLKAHPPKTPKIFVETSTIYPAVAGELDAKITSIPHTHFVVAPVWGPPAADKAQLIVVLAGEYKIRKEIAYLVVPAVGRKVIDMGGNVEKALALKLTGNAFILGAIELLAETMTLADKSGVGAANLQMLIGYGQKMLTDSFDGATALSIEGGLKDASHIRRLALESNTTVPTVDIAHQHLVTARALETSALSPSKPPFEILDWSALVSALRIAAGLPGFDSAKHGGVQKA
ncbi:hypothetical protein BS47DRAFT_1341483 [Hydnum rufescens UP504]|uniref:6-phosphogluconate dehydrogenase NADP-binding domain-containing protein n=1 Tax=Hydnum rufescens UP504 TaxID=1448309 RepID=A0A9P6B2R0_9AGAM|nr:hypothetical protein BS47DRAFT_1341483 [Hydnum rufescens UP504]